MKHYLIYQIRNKLNGMIYIGQHQTENLNDGYMGSGLRIQRAIEKYGIDNFEKTILFECSSEEEMNKKEAEIVNEDFIARDDVYNIIIGGSGNWDYINSNKEFTSKRLKTRWNNLSLDEKEKQINFLKSISPFGIGFNKKFSNEISNGLKKAYIKNPNSFGMSGKHHSEKTKKILSKNKIGSNNPNYGKHWYWNPNTNEERSFYKNEKIPNGWIKGRYISEEQILKNSGNNNFMAKNRGYFHWYWNPETNEYKFLDSRKEIPNGFILKGLPMKESTKLKRIEISKQKHKELTEKYYLILKPMFDVYYSEGFKAVVEKFHYNKTYNALNQAFKKYMPEEYAKMQQKRK